jgi:hypothetical protein
VVPLSRVAGEADLIVFIRACTTGPFVGRIMTMAKETKKTTETTEAEFRPATAADFSQLIDANGNNFGAFVKSSEALWSGMAAIGQEMMQFASTRLRENMELSGSVMQCGDPREAFRLECDYAKTTTQQYLDEASKLMGLTAEMSQRSWAPIENVAKETLGRLNRR